MIEICEVSHVKKKLAYIRIEKKEKCNSCNSCAFDKKKSIVIPALMEKECKKGDTVKVEMPKKSVMFASIFMYLIPIVFLFIGFFIGTAFNHEILQFALALTFASGSFILIWLIDSAYRKNKNFMPVVTDVLVSSTDITDSEITVEIINEE